MTQLSGQFEECMGKSNFFQMQSTKRSIHGMPPNQLRFPKRINHFDQGWLKFAAHSLAQWLIQCVKQAEFINLRSQSTKVNACNRLIEVVETGRKTEKGRQKHGVRLITCSSSLW